MILNLKYLNKSVEKIHFKMDTLRAAIAPLKTDCFFSPLDVHNAYYSLPIDRGFRKFFFRFTFRDRLFEF